jgi:hypothetical protein
VASCVSLLPEDTRRHRVKESIERGEGEQKVEELMSAAARFSGR